MNPQRIALLKAYIEKEPHEPFNTYALAMEYYEEQPEAAIGLLRKLLSEHPDYLPTYFKAANLLWDMEAWEDAETTFTQGIKLAETQADQKALSELKASYQNFVFDRD